MAGASLAGQVRRAELALAAIIVGLGAGPAGARAEIKLAVAIPETTLDEALIRLGEQTGLSIVSTDTGIRSVRTRAVRGRLSVRSAIARLLRGTGFGFSLIDPQTVRVFRKPGVPPPANTAAIESAPAGAGAEIVVTASKSGTTLDSYPGGVSILDLDDRQARGAAAQGSEAIVSRLPGLVSTSLGPGRNKLFVRGVADSSFNGPTQATVGQYLGDVRLTYNAPDPDLNLYDVRRVELLEGPQGTLYGTGALGGILRIVPNPPDLDDLAASLAAGFITTHSGGEGGDAEAMVNVPVLNGRVALRAVGYGVVDPGYIDDRTRRLKDVNRTDTTGGRVTLRVSPGDDWTFDAGGVFQSIASRDGQYAERGFPPLTRASNLAQPFDNDYLLGFLTAGKDWSWGTLISATGVVRQDIGTSFDATDISQAGVPTLFTESSEIQLFSHETRLSGSSSLGDWIGGVSFVHDVQRIRRSLGDPSAPLPITGVRNLATEAALFGQVAVPVAARLTVTAGGRLTRSSARGAALDTDTPEDDQPQRRETRLSPTLALLWRASTGVSVFARYQQGFRAGGLAVSQSDASESVQRFEADAISTAEVGVRAGQRGVDPLSASVTASFTRWSDIQADLLDTGGLPFTANIGDGRIIGLEAEASWSPSDAVQIEAAGFLSDSAFTAPAPDFVASGGGELPNIAEVGGRLGAGWYLPISARAGLLFSGALRYVGKSRLGIGPPLDIGQGNFTEASLGARLDLGPYAVSLDIGNVLDSRGNRFSFGNPFTLADRRQVTPLRPRSIRIGIDARF